MERHFIKEIDRIHHTAMGMATLVEEAVGYATEAFLAGDGGLALRVVDNDARINSLESDIDRMVFEFLALNHPVAKDLRFLLSIDKMNKDLERTGDHAVNIAQAALAYAGLGHPINLDDLPLMVTLTRRMLSDSLTGFSRLDQELALRVLACDDGVDELNHSLTSQVIEKVKQDTASVEAALELIKVIKNLERIADLSTNIAEDIIFNTEARDVKHHKREYVKEFLSRQGLADAGSNPRSGEGMVA